MTALSWFAENQVLVLAGWTLLLVLWESATLAILFAGWRAMRPGAPARAQYLVAAVMLGLTVFLAAATPVVLTRVPAAVPERQRTVASGRAEAPIAVSRSASHGTPAPPAPDHIAGVPANSVAGWLGVAWFAGAALLAVKLLGGWLFASRIRHRAVPVTDPAALASASRARRHLGVGARTALLQSAEVEAPVVVGWRRPALILPYDVTEHLSPDLLEPLLVHEFAHIKRRDYVANLLQTCADLLLFFSPPAHWISRRMREAREYCCDDIAVVGCADRRDYVRSLTTLAALGTLHRARPSLGAAGPRLIERVRRLLQEESMQKSSPVRLASLIVALMAVTITGAKVGALSAAGAASGLRAAVGAVQTSIPFGYAMEQPGSAAVLTRVVSSAEHPWASATIRNMATEPIAGVAFVAVVEFFPRAPVRIFQSEILPVSIAPGQTVDIAPGVLTADQLQEVAARHTGRAQLFFGLARIRYANGIEWSVTPNPDATSSRDALSLPRPDLPRALVSPAGTQPQTNGTACYDEQRKTYSPGATIPIRGEPGRVVRCVGGLWIETAVR